jgi:hypothetical protein
VHRGSGGACGCEQVGGIVNLKAFFVAALSSALDQGIAVPDDVVRHVTPDVLAVHLPRPLWARLLTACVGAARVDAQLVVETIGVPNLCEHVPAQIIWDCIQEIARRSLDGVVMAVPSASSRPTTAPTGSTMLTSSMSSTMSSGMPPGMSSGMSSGMSRPVPLSTPPPPPAAEPKPAEPRSAVSVGPSIPAPGADEPEGRRAQSGQRFRPNNTGVGRLGANIASPRRPQAQATTSPTEPERGDRGAVAPGGAGDRNDRGVPRPRRGQTEADYDLETFVGGKDDWKTSLAVEDEQLVDWSASDETVTNGEEIGRKR